MNSGILISACLIVKNEAKNLDRCLKSVQGLADEIVAVDTGSTDETINILKHYGASVYCHDWQNDFSLHRNQAISYTKGRWIFIIDADEEVCFAEDSSPEKVRQFLCQLKSKFPCSAVLLRDIQKGSSVMQFYTSRFFRQGTVRYEGIVHNQPQVKGMAMICPMMFIKHYGYDLAPEQKEQKFQRTKTLLLKQVKEKKIENGLPYFYLCQLYANNLNAKEAVVWGEKYGEYCEKNKVEKEKTNLSHSYTMAKQYMKIGNAQKTSEWLNKGNALLKGDLDLTAATLEFAIWQKDKDLEMNAARDFVELYKIFTKDSMQMQGKFVFSMRTDILAIVYMHLATCCLQKGGESLKALFGILGEMPVPFREGLMKELNERLSQSVVPFQFKSTAEKEEASTVTKTEETILTTLQV